MLKKFSPDVTNWLNEVTADRILDNVYLYIDSQTYGYISKNIMTWISYDDSGPKCIVYKYYNSLQLLQIDLMSEFLIMEIWDLIVCENINMVSGDETLIGRIYEFSGRTYQLDGGYTFSMIKRDCQISNKTVWAEYDQCGEIAALICSDKSIGGHYSARALQSQLEERMLNWGCRSRIIMKDGEIVSHMATYAEQERIAVLGGLVTRDDYRRKGFGCLVLTDLALSLLKEEKQPVLYCYKESLWDWYVSLGWEKVKACAKLEKIM